MRFSLRALTPILALAGLLGAAPAPAQEIPTPVIITPAPSQATPTPVPDAPQAPLAQSVAPAAGQHSVALPLVYGAPLPPSPSRSAG